MDIMYIDNNRVKIHMDMLIVSVWNKCIDIDEKIYINDKEFFENSFENSYDAAFAVSIGSYWWADDFVYFDAEGHLISFSRLDDENCPIDMDRIDISNLINVLQELQELNKKGCVNNIPRAIHDALQEA